ncbi:MAG TPA: biotin/lipoyl-containing protein [Terriglobales bacterium]|nr:biotin/lipoyl-containing protein [Terriglobales bacterium]
MSTVVVPKAGGVTTTKANVVRWIKREGEPVNKGEPLVELSTDKISYELDSPVGGVLRKMLAAETVDVPVGDPLCEIEE